MSEIDELKVTQIWPVRKQSPLKGLYLGEDLLGMAKESGRSVVFADYLTDKNGVVAKADKPAHFQVPPELKNPSDWRLFQELMAQADVVISAGAYFKRLTAPGSAPQDILYPFEPGNAFEELGQWRLDAGYLRRSPDLAVVSRHLDFEFPQALMKSGRTIAVFTTDAMARSDKAETLRAAGARVVASGETEVNGRVLVTTLRDGMGYRVIMMTSGPSVLQLLLSTKSLDLLYVTRAQKEIPFADPATVQTMVSGNGGGDALKEFSLAHEFVQENVVAEDGSVFSQSFLRYDRKDMRQQE